MTAAKIHEIYTLEMRDGAEPGTVMMLKARDRDDFLPIFITAPQGRGIAAWLRNHPQERPRTFGLMAELVTKLGGHVERAEIQKFEDGVFFARLLVSGHGTTHEIDCRPSDALALATQLGAPIFVAPPLLFPADNPETALLGGNVQVVKPFEL